MRRSAQHNKDKRINDQLSALPVMAELFDAIAATLRRVMLGHAEVSRRVGGIRSIFQSI